MPKSSICQTCFNFSCSWHQRFEPVDGWTATPTKIYNQGRLPLDSFHVDVCPLYKPREDNPLVAEKDRKRAGLGPMEPRRVSAAEVARDLSISVSAVLYWRRQGDRGLQHLSKLYASQGLKLVKYKPTDRKRRGSFFLAPVELSDEDITIFFEKL